MEYPVAGEFFDVALVFYFVVQFDQARLTGIELIDIALFGCAVEL